MSQSGSQAAAFFRDVCRNRVVWLVRNDEGSPTHLSEHGGRSLPFWSTQHRAQRAADIWGHGLCVESMPLDTWCEHVLPDAARDGLVIGINWSGPHLVGWSLTTKEVLNRLAAADQPTASLVSVQSPPADECASEDEEGFVEVVADLPADRHHPGARPRDSRGRTAPHHR
ncbi:DUF2750 domain-containing protein [Streptomyces sp. NPDC088194]|uniref:DUF2750 domain-containing protein n=1 Tax=Streptomyces sp. NPDC088194 TaxID=3154931 RepID=UPI00344DEA46